MATIIEDYVSFEIAKLLKEKGFSENTICRYADVGGITEKWYDDYRERVLHFDWDEGYLIEPSIEPKDQYEIIGDTISAPTLQMAMKWLREVHGVTIVIDTNDIWLGKGNRFYWCKIYYKMGDRIEIKWYNDPSKPKDILRYQTYEQACEAAIKYSIENLI